MIKVLREELEYMILQDYPYSQILKKSEELDEYIIIEFKKINKGRLLHKKECMKV